MGFDVCNRVPSGHRLFDVSDTCWLCLWISLGVRLGRTCLQWVYLMCGRWPIVASATIIGSTCSFILSRTLLSNFVNRLTANDRRFEALSLVLKHDGLSLLVAIRLCPLPYVGVFPVLSDFSIVAISLHDDHVLSGSHALTCTSMHLNQ